MMKEPWFWREATPGARFVSTLLSPLSFIYDAARRRRLATTIAETPPAPVVCIGNATVGGVGKTPFAMMLAPMLAARGFKPAFLTRGHGGRLAGPLRVDPSVHNAQDVGDEPLLLADIAPTYVARDRPTGARLAARGGADLIIMDDGYQNTSIEKTVSVLLIAEHSSVSGRLLPAGPFREPLREAIERADIVVEIGATPRPIAGDSRGKPTFSAWLEPAGAEGAHKGVVAFCGIGAPMRFFVALERAGFRVLEKETFADHHSFTRGDLTRLEALAQKHGAELITTRKDFVRLRPEDRPNIRVFDALMRVNDAPRLTDLIVARAQEFQAKARHV
jgi:tetraacyldisaccharide 4'-kinase